MQWLTHVIAAVLGGAIALTVMYYSGSTLSIAELHRLEQQVAFLKTQLAESRRLEERPGRPAQRPQLQLNIAAAFTKTTTRTLMAPLQIAALTKAGTIPMPDTTQYVLIEIGCSDRHTLDETLGNRPGAFLISFEPLLDKYAVLLSRGTTRYHGKKADRAVPLAHHHERGVVLPLAVAAVPGMHNFSVAAIAGCSSLSALNTNAGWAPWCRRQIEARWVPSITLAAALHMSGSHLPVRELKIDAQGVDFELIRSTPPAMLRKRVERIELEVRASDCSPLYIGQRGCDDVVLYMHSIGFANTTRCPSKYWFNRFEYVQCERRLTFKRIIHTPSTNSDE